MKNATPIKPLAHKWHSFLKCKQHTGPEKIILLHNTNWKFVFGIFFSAVLWEKVKTGLWTCQN